MSCRQGCDKHIHNPTQLANYAQHRLRNNQHFVWASVGPPGSGKSEGNILLGIQIQGRDIDVRRQVCFKPHDRKRMSQALPRYSVILDDESTGEGGHKRRAMSTANVDNVQDLDAMRGRNQATGFAAPRLVDLDAQIQAHLMGYMEWHQDHSCEWFEAIRSGPQWAPNVFWESRFTVPEPPSLQEHYPSVRAAYLEAKDDHMKGRTSKSDAVFLEDRFYGILNC
jgi:hypothetical protein